MINKDFSINSNIQKFCKEKWNYSDIIIGKFENSLSGSLDGDFSNPIRKVIFKHKKYVKE